MRGDSAEVVQPLLTARFGAVLLDNWMPKINGIELRRLIRSLDKKLLIFFCSGAVIEGDKKAAFDAVRKAILESPLTRKNSPLPLCAAMNIQPT